MNINIESHEWWHSDKSWRVLTLGYCDMENAKSMHTAFDGIKNPPVQLKQKRATLHLPAPRSMWCCLKQGSKPRRSLNIPFCLWQTETLSLFVSEGFISHTNTEHLPVKTQASGRNINLSRLFLSSGGHISQRKYSLSLSITKKQSKFWKMGWTWLKRVRRRQALTLWVHVLIIFSNYHM